MSTIRTAAIITGTTTAALVGGTAISGTIASAKYRFNFPHKEKFGEAVGMAVGTGILPAMFIGIMTAGIARGSGPRSVTIGAGLGGAAAIEGLMVGAIVPRYIHDGGYYAGR